MKYARLYCDDAGESHFEDVDVKLLPVNFAPPASPMNVSEPQRARQLLFLCARAGWVSDWHPAPKRQFLFRLAGEFETTVSGGETRRFPAGSILLVEDTTGKGHVSRVISQEDALTAVVQLD
jgi:hypothetical protein